MGGFDRWDPGVFQGSWNKLFIPLGIPGKVQTLENAKRKTDNILRSVIWSCDGGEFGIPPPQTAVTHPQIPQPVRHNKPDRKYGAENRLTQGEGYPI